MSLGGEEEGALSDGAVDLVVQRVAHAPRHLLQLAGRAQRLLQRLVHAAAQTFILRGQQQGL